MLKRLLEKRPKPRVTWVEAHDPAVVQRVLRQPGTFGNDETDDAVRDETSLDDEERDELIARCGYCPDDPADPLGYLLGTAADVQLVQPTDDLPGDPPWALTPEQVQQLCARLRPHARPGDDDDLINELLDVLAAENEGGGSDPPAAIVHIS